MKAKFYVCMVGAGTLLILAVSPSALAQKRLSSKPGNTSAEPSRDVSGSDLRGLPQNVLQVIRWLPEDSESIMLARGPFQDGTLKDFRNPQTAVPPNSTQKPPPDFQQESLAATAGLFGLTGTDFIRNIRNHEISFIVAAARRFGPPVIGGASTWQGAQIIIFRDAVPDVGIVGKAQERLSLVEMERNGVVRLDTQESWGFKGEKVSVYYAKPKPSVLIAATDADFLKTMLQRIAQPLTARTPLLNFPEWNYVDVQLPVWGVRHRRTATPIYVLAKSDKDGLPFSELVGISFSYAPKPAARMAYQFHFTENARDQVRQAVDANLKLLAPTVAEQRLTIRADTVLREPGSTTPGEATFVVQHLMGYVVCP
jgi:hypothetical protein